jgi:type I restriction enzyme S subunit
MKSENAVSTPKEFPSDHEELPEGWIFSTIGECFSDIKNGTTVQQNNEKKGIPISRIETIQKAKFDLNRIQHIENPTSELIKNYQYQIGDIAFSHINSLEHVGKTALYEGNPEVFLHGMNLLRLRIGRPDISPKFAYYFMQTNFFRDEVRSRVGKAVNQVSINKKNLATVPFLIAPFSEQQRIVARVEALLTHINATRNQLSRVPSIMKKFRQAVLAAACSGRLTDGWRAENLDVEPAIELLQKIKPEVRGKKINAKKATNDFFDFDQFELPNLWTWTTTSDICTEISDGDHYPPPKIPSGVPFIVISNVSSGSIDFTKTMFASQKYYDELAINRKPQFGDILYTVTGSYGIPVIVDTHKEFCFQRHIALLRPHPIIPSEFLWILMKSEMIYQQSKSIATGIAQLTVPLAGLRVLKIPLPPLAEQHEIVRRVGLLFERADAFDREVAAAGRRCERLTQAVLGKAFAGKL